MPRVERKVISIVEALKNQNQRQIRTVDAALLNDEQFDSLFAESPQRWNVAPVVLASLLWILLLAVG